MITSYPLTATPATTGGLASRRTSPVPRTPEPSSARYEGERRSRVPLVIALAVSAAVHVGLLFGLAGEQRVPVQVIEDTTMLVSLVMPQVQELEEPDLSSDERPEIRFDTLVIPRQMDMPTIALATDFVQALDFSSIIDTAKLKASEIVIPDTARQVADKVGTIFNLADLDRRPEIIFQPEMTYPPELKRTDRGGRLMVEFVVDENGVPRDAVVTESSDSGFDASARNGILRWRFRPGMKGGLKVSTRMRVPIEFRVVD